MLQLVSFWARCVECVCAEAPTEGCDGSTIHIYIVYTRAQLAIATSIIYIYSVCVCVLFGLHVKQMFSFRRDVDERAARAHTHVMVYFGHMRFGACVFYLRLITIIQRQARASKRVLAVCAMHTQFGHTSVDATRLRGTRSV